MDTELSGELLESKSILPLLPGAGNLPRFSNIGIAQLSAGIAADYAVELVGFHCLAISTLSEDLI